MQTLITSKQHRLPPIIAIDILAAVRWVDPLARRSAVAFRRTAEDDCLIRVGRIWEGDRLGRWGGSGSVREGLDGDGSGGDGCGDCCGYCAVGEGEEEGGVEEAEDGEKNAGFEVL